MHTSGVVWPSEVELLIMDPSPFCAPNTRAHHAHKNICSHLRHATVQCPNAAAGDFPLRTHITQSTQSETATLRLPLAKSLTHIHEQQVRLKRLSTEVRKRWSGHASASVAWYPRFLVCIPGRPLCHPVGNLLPHPSQPLSILVPHVT